MIKIIMIVLIVVIVTIVAGCSSNWKVVTTDMRRMLIRVVPAQGLQLTLTITEDAVSGDWQSVFSHSQVRHPA